MSWETENGPVVDVLERPEPRPVVDPEVMARARAKAEAAKARYAARQAEAAARPVKTVIVDRPPTWKMAGRVVNGLVVPEVARRHCTRRTGMDLIPEVGRDGRLSVYCCKSWLCPSQRAFQACRVAERLPEVLGPDGRLWVGELDLKGMGLLRKAVSEAARAAGNASHRDTPLEIQELVAEYRDGNGSQPILGHLARRESKESELWWAFTNVDVNARGWNVHLDEIDRQEGYEDVVRRIAEGPVAGLSWPRWNPKVSKAREFLAVYAGTNPYAIETVHRQVGLPVTYAQGRQVPADVPWRWQTEGHEPQAGYFELPSDTDPEQVKEQLKTAYIDYYSTEGRS